jgi:5'(3')-deoxyribonucleotidase
MRIGFDVDGVLADFNTAFMDYYAQVVGEDKFPKRPFDIPTWDYPAFYGYTKEQDKAVWGKIVQDKTFWWKLPLYPWTEQVLQKLDELEHDGADVYYITSRPGISAKWQTEAWLRDHGCELYDRPTVLVSSLKGHCAKALHLDLYFDDKNENCEDVLNMAHDTRCITVAQPWNKAVGCERVEPEGLLEVLTNATA